MKDVLISPLSTDFEAPMDSSAPLGAFLYEICRAGIRHPRKPIRLEDFNANEQETQVILANIQEKFL